jgi:ABC-type Fe3+-hydroxamate transport system substrate-binding protein
VPGNLNLRATSVLERDIFNQEFEGTWQAHLETLSDAELRQMNPEVVFCGLFDKVERVNRVYEDELARRKLKM